MDVQTYDTISWPQWGLEGLDVGAAVRGVYDSIKSQASGAVLWLRPRVGDVFDGFTVRGIFSQYKEATVAIVEAAGGELRYMLLGLVVGAEQLERTMIFGLVELIKSATPVTKQAVITAGQVTEAAMSELEDLAESAVKPTTDLAMVGLAAAFILGLVWVVK